MVACIARRELGPSIKAHSGEEKVELYLPSSSPPGLYTRADVGINHATYGRFTFTAVALLCLLMVAMFLGIQALCREALEMAC